MTATGIATSTGAALGYRAVFPADRPCSRSTTSPPIAAAIRTASITIRRAASVRLLTRLPACRRPEPPHAAGPR